MPTPLPSSSAPSRSGLAERPDLPALVTRALVGSVQLYRIFLRPLAPPSCRFAPSCSQYAIDALERHGPLRGTRLAFARVARCHPRNPGGYDPVPLRET